MKELKFDPLNVIVTGVGGQGNVLVSQILGQAFLNQGFITVVGETFGLSQRGGHVESHLRISKNKEYGPLIPEGGAHVLVGLEPLETLRVLPKYGRPDIEVLVNGRPVPPLNVNAGEADYPGNREAKDALKQLAANVRWIPATAEAQKLGSAVTANVVLLGALLASDLIPLDMADIEKVLPEIVPEDRLEINQAALKRGAELA